MLQRQNILIVQFILLHEYLSWPTGLKTLSFGAHNSIVNTFLLNFKNALLVVNVLTVVESSQDLIQDIFIILFEGGTY